MKYSRQDLAQGMILRDEAKEVAGNFGTMDGAVEPKATISPPKSRMAGQQGERIKDLMNNPEEVARTQQWMRNFSNPMYDKYA